MFYLQVKTIRQTVDYNPFEIYIEVIYSQVCKGGMGVDLRKDNNLSVNLNDILRNIYNIDFAMPYFGFVTKYSILKPYSRSNYAYQF